MKVLNRICQVLAIAFGVVALVTFFLKFATISYGDKSLDAVGAVLAFGGKLGDFDMAKSSDILFCFFLTVFGLLSSIFSFKTKKLRYTAPALGLGSAIYMLVIALSNPPKFVDSRPISTDYASVTVEYAPFVLICAIALFLFAAAGIAYLLIDDALEVAASKGEKLTIPKRVVQFFRNYKSEIKKIVWPTFRDVLKNTVIVLIMCLVIGILIWLFDKGLGELLKLILT